MDFSNIARQLNEGMESTEAAISSSEKAVAGGQKQLDQTRMAKQKQKDMRAAPQRTAASGISYASEEARSEREEMKMMESQMSDWRQELIEAAGPNDDPNHPFVDVMPFMNNKLNQAKKQMQAAAGDTMREGGKQAKMAEENTYNNPFMQRHMDAKNRIRQNRQNRQNSGGGNPSLERHRNAVQNYKNRNSVNEEESAMDKALALMKSKYGNALTKPSKKKEELSDEERDRRARNRAKFNKKEHDRLYGRKND